MSCITIILTLMFIGTALGGSLEHRSANADDCAKVFKGCRVKAGECLCGQKQACSNPFPYRNEHQCFKDLRGEFDKCKKNPCENGVCLMVKMDGHHKTWCSCAASGFYGKHCEQVCPEDDRVPRPKDFPTDCIF